MADRSRQPPDPLGQVRIERSVFRETFSTAYGKEVLAWIGNRCGAWAQKPEAVKPELIAFWNTLLGACGIVHTENLRTIAAALLEASNDEDLVLIRRAAQEAAKEE